MHIGAIGEAGAFGVESRLLLLNSLLPPACFRSHISCSADQRRGTAIPHHIPTSDQTRLPAEFKHINKRRKRN